MFDSNLFIEKLSKDIQYELFKYMDKDFIKFIENKKNNRLENYFYSYNLLFRNHFCLFDYLNLRYSKIFNFNIKEGLRKYNSELYYLYNKQKNQFDIDNFFIQNLIHLLYKLLDLNNQNNKKEKLIISSDIFFILFTYQKEWFLNFINFFEFEEYIYLKLLNSYYFLNIQNIQHIDYLIYLNNLNISIKLTCFDKNQSLENFNISSILNREHLINYSFLNYFLTQHKNFIFKENSLQLKPYNYLIKFLFSYKYFNLFIELKDHFDLHYELYILTMKYFNYNTKYYLNKLIELNVPKNEKICTYVAQKGNLDLLEFFHNNNFPWNKDTTFAACENLQFDCLLYALENGCKTNLKLKNIIQQKIKNHLIEENEFEQNHIDKTTNYYRLKLKHYKNEYEKICKMKNLIDQYFYFYFHN